MMFHLGNHGLRILTSFPLLGEGSEAAVDQHLVPLRVVANHPGHHLARHVAWSAGAQLHLLLVIHHIVAGMDLLHHPELVCDVGAGGGGANTPCGTLQTLSFQPPDQADGALHGMIPDPLHLAH